MKNDNFNSIRVKSKTKLSPGKFEKDENQKTNRSGSKLA